ncbi:hypothetical protein LTS10_008601 [Elasticomyces elasticus]|nr:hypothetical protein LTS10_008601 [Elasticomyces elasticus]
MLGGLRETSGYPVSGLLDLLRDNEMVGEDAKVGSNQTPLWLVSSTLLRGKRSNCTVWTDHVQSQHAPTEPCNCKDGEPPDSEETLDVERVTAAAVEQGIDPKLSLGLSMTSSASYAQSGAQAEWDDRSEVVDSDDEDRYAAALKQNLEGDGQPNFARLRGSRMCKKRKGPEPLMTKGRHEEEEDSSYKYKEIGFPAQRRPRESK